MSDDLKTAALRYHEFPKPGKWEITPTKQMTNQRDLALAYSPGVAAACSEIERDPRLADRYTNRANLVAVISNGTAVLGLGAIGALASKPVMEGKAVLFKKFADVNCIDLEVNETDTEKFVEIVAALEPSFGGVNLEDIKAPQCFAIEKALRERMKIPVFHDDQHGTAICVAAGIRNGLRVAKKSLDEVRLVCSGAGAAAIACLNLLVEMGLPRHHITICDRKGVVYVGREAPYDEYKAQYAQDGSTTTLSEAMQGADIFLGVSGPGSVSAEQIASMGDRPMVFTLANPEPEIRPEIVKEVKPDAMIATGRSDYPNQINNVLCFPFIFRGALDVGATEINEAMKMAAVEAIADIAMREPSDIVARAYQGVALEFGAEYLIPKPFDPRLMTDVPMRVAQAAMDSGVASRPLEDVHHYRRTLRQFVIRSGMVMEPVVERATESTQRIVFAEGEDKRVLSAMRDIIAEGICRPVIIGRTDVVMEHLRQLGLRYQAGKEFDLVDPITNPQFEAHWNRYHALMGRRGVSPGAARNAVQGQSTVLAALMLAGGEVDAMICGVVGRYAGHLDIVRDIIGVNPGLHDCAALTLLILKGGAYFITDTHVSVRPSAEQIAENTAMAAKLVERFGLVPKAALLSHSNFGTRDNPDSQVMRNARELLQSHHPMLAVEGEMHADSALAEGVRNRVFPNARFQGEANLLVCPNLDSANIAYNMVKILGEAVPVGPMLMGMRQPAHVMTDSATVRGIVNMAAVAAVDAQRARESSGASE